MAKHQEYAVAFSIVTRRWEAVHQDLAPPSGAFADHYVRAGRELCARKGYYDMPRLAPIARGLRFAEATAWAQRENVTMVREGVTVDVRIG